MTTAPATSAPVVDFFSRYRAEPGRELVTFRKEETPPGELATLARTAVSGFALIWDCFTLALAIIWRRIRMRVVETFTRIMHSLRTAWAVAGLGWGVSVVVIAYPTLMHMMR